MIEIIVMADGTYHEKFFLLTSLFNWVMSELKTKPDYQDIFVQGFLSLYDTSGRASGLIMCVGEDMKGVLEILKQPPGEFKDKYVAYKVCEEPDPVVEVEKEEKDDSSSDGDSEVKDEKT